MAAIINKNNQYWNTSRYAWKLGNHLRARCRQAAERASFCTSPDRKDKKYQPVVPMEDGNDIFPNIIPNMGNWKEQTMLFEISQSKPIFKTPLVRERHQYLKAIRTNMVDILYPWPHVWAPRQERVQRIKNKRLCDNVCCHTIKGTILPPTAGASTMPSKIHNNKHYKLVTIGCAFVGSLFRRFPQHVSSRKQGNRSEGLNNNVFIYV